MPNGQAATSTAVASAGSSTSNAGAAGPGAGVTTPLVNPFLGNRGNGPAPTAPPHATMPTNPATAPTSTPSSPRHWTPPPATHVKPNVFGSNGGDPLYVLDLNTGETLPTVPLNTFSTWNENLLAQVSGATVSSYSWNTSQAPDLTNISGQNAAQLQGTWANFSGATRTDVLSVTETPTSGSPLTATFTFQVASTSSPAYASQPPTSSITWPSVIAPDQISNQQVTEPAGSYAVLGLADGSVQTSFTMPSYNPNTTPVSLSYNSTTANAQPIFVTEYQLPQGQSVPATITAQLTFNNTALATVTYNTAGLNPGDIMQIALQANATNLSTGRYPWQITVTNGSNQTNYSGDVDIVNQADSPFGAGWSLDNVEQLVPVSGGVILVQPGGTSLWFASNGQGGYTTPAGNFSTLVQNADGSYTQTLTDGTQLNFNSSGQETSTVDTNGNTATFGYTGSLLTSITDTNGQVTTLTYNTSGQLTNITDPANRTATLAYSGNQLTGITDPAGNVWRYGYDSANDLTTLTDPNNNTTTFTYNFADRVASATQADGSTEQLAAEQMNGLATPGTGSSGDPAAAVLRATGDQAQFTDANDDVWVTSLDWLGFGLDTLDADPLGDTSVIYRDANGLPWLSADPLGRATRDFFDNRGNITETVAPDGSTQEYSYNQFSEVAQYTSQIDAVTTYSYNNDGDLTQMTDALGGVTTYADNAAGLVTSTTDPMGNTTTYAYNALNELTSTTNALGDATSYAYDSAGDLTSTTNALGDTTTYSYNALGLMTGETLPDTPGVYSTYSYTYDGVGKVLSATDALGNTTTYGYNAVNELVGTTNSLGDATTYGHDAVGNLTSMTDPLGNTTSYAYNAADELVSVTDPLGNQTTYGYDAAGEKTSMTDPLGNVTDYTYNARGEVTNVSVYAPGQGGGLKGLAAFGPDAKPQAPTTMTLVQQTSYTYCACGCMTGVTSLNVVAVTVTANSSNAPFAGPNGPGGLNNQSTSYTYNKLDELTSMTDADGNTATYAYNADGDQTSVTDPNGNTTTYGYNALNELTSTTAALGNTTTFSYDAVGDLVTATDPLGNATSYTYNAQSRELTKTAANGGVTSYAYDLDGNETSITDPAGNTTTYAYNAANELIASTNPMGYQSTYAYNAGGLLTSTTDAAGRTIDYGYNADGEETSVTWVGGNYTASYQYNADGEMTKASDPYSTYTYTYNAMGQETSASNAGTPSVPTVMLSYGYDSFGNRTSLTDSLGGSISYSYNADNEMTSLGLSVSGTLDAQVTFSYGGDGNLTGTTRTAPAVNGDTLATSYSYNADDELTNITNTDTTQNVTLANYTYGYNADGELTSYQDNSGNSLTYSYDRVGELTGATGTLAGSSYSATYAYDLNGNRTSTSTDVGGSLTSATYTTASGNELTNDGTYSYTYDHDGNMTSQTNLATGSVTYYSWDYENRLTGVKVENSQGQVLEQETFTYDMFGHRISESVNGTPALYTVYDGSNAYMDFNGSGQLLQRYLTNPRGLNQFYGQVSASGTTQWFLTDNIGSIRLVVSAGGVVLDGITYDAYGNILSQTNATYAPRFLYAGAAYDPLTGMYLDGAREDDPLDGRWLSQDPLSFGGGDANLYRYTFNNPVQFTDPSGEILPLLIVGVALALGGTGGLYYAANRYDNASATYLSLPANQWTPAVQAEYQSYIRTTDYIAAGSEVAGVTGISMVATPVMGYGSGYLWSAGGTGGRLFVGTMGVGGLGSAGYGGYRIASNWNNLSGPERLRQTGNLAGPLLVGSCFGPRYFQQGLIAGRPTYNLGGMGEAPGAINVQPPGAPMPPEPYVISPSNQLPFPPGSGNVIVNGSPISPDRGLPLLGPPYMPGQVVSVAGGGGRIIITQGTGTPGTLTAGQSAVLGMAPTGSSSAVTSGPFTTTLTITTPLSYPAWGASYGPAAWSGYYGLATNPPVAPDW